MFQLHEYFLTTKILVRPKLATKAANRYFTAEAWFENLTALREIEGQSSQSSEYF
jgi:hypothetical protein